MDFPDINPIAFSLGPLAVHWYGLAYMAGFLLGWRYMLMLAGRGAAKPDKEDIDDFISWAILGVILGGRLGYILFYKLDFYVENPLEILKVWRGGMSFHGGVLGVAVAMVIFAGRRKFSLLGLSDMVACAAPIGLFFGRIANFVNGELYGRVTNVPWGIKFPNAGPEPRHPSQLYEALLEGALLFVILLILTRKGFLKTHAGLISGVFLMGYGVFRIFIEMFFRVPDAYLGEVFLGLSMGQILSAPMIVLGAGLFIFALQKREKSEA